MNLRNVLFCLLSIFLASPKIFAENKDQVHWDYGTNTWDEGVAHGTALWGQLDPAYKICEDGKSQSPINILSTDAILGVSLEAPELNFSCPSFDVKKKGHTLEVFCNSKNSIWFEKKNYELVKFYFHQPSEHTIEGKKTKIEIQFLFENNEKRFLIVAVLVDKGRTNFSLNKIFDTFDQNSSLEKLTSKDRLEPLDLFPKERGYYTYNGSLTIPPCTEGVRWIVFSKHIQASGLEIRKLTKIVALNARAVQPLNGRKLQRKP